MSRVTYRHWFHPHELKTPDGQIVARVRERYRGLRGQWRICLVDKLGRVHHYDEEQVIA